jgi:hypothetical protein
MIRCPDLNSPHKTSGSSSVGRASASQAEGRGFESHFPLINNQGLTNQNRRSFFLGLHKSVHKLEIAALWLVLLPIQILYSGRSKAEIHNHPLISKYGIPDLRFLKLFSRVKISACFALMQRNFQ